MTVLRSPAAIRTLVATLAITAALCCGFRLCLFSGKVMASDSRIHATVPVRPTLTGTLPLGVSLISFEAVPSHVSISGPVRLISGISGLPTTPVALDDHTASFENRASIIFPEGITPTTPIDEVQIQITIAPIRESRTLHDIPVICTQTRFHWTLLPPRVDLRVHGIQEVLDAGDFPARVSVHIDAAGLKPGIYVRRAVVDLPDGVILLGAIPEVFTIRLHSESSHPPDA